MAGQCAENLFMDMNMERADATVRMGEGRSGGAEGGRPEQECGRLDGCHGETSSAGGEVRPASTRRPRVSLGRLAGEGKRARRMNGPGQADIDSGAARRHVRAVPHHDNAMPDPGDLSYCAQQVHQADHDRFLTALFAPAARREALFALYALNVALSRIGETVSQPMLGEIRLQWWRESLDGIYAGTPRREPVVEALAATVAPHNPPRALFDALIDSRSLDLYDEAPADLAALEAYAEGTAASLTRLAVICLDDEKDGAGEKAAREIGIAWGLIGLVRALPFHAAQGRVFLPADLLGAEQVSPRDLLAGRGGPGLRRVLDAVLSAAESHLAAGRRLKGEVSRRAVPALLPAALADLYLARLRRPDFDPFTTDTGLPAFRRQLHLLAKALRGRY